MTPFVQAERPLRITTPLGPDALVLTSFRGREAVSELFHYQVDAVWSNATPMDFKNILGKNVTVQLTIADAPRYFNGIVRSVSEGAYDRGRDITLYTLEIVPDTWLLTRTMYSRIFQNMTAPEIIRKILSDKGLSATLKTNLTATYSKRDYCVQYRESDFAFISRLMEDEGIFYFFQHANGSHTLTLGDSPNAFPDISDPDIEFDEVVGGTREENRIVEWSKSQEIRSGKYSVGDWNFETPSTNLLANTGTNIKVGGNDKLELYDYPAAYLNKADGETLSKLRMEAEEAPGQISRGRSTHNFLCPGYRFNLKQHLFNNGRYTLTQVTHVARQPLATGQQGSGFNYENEFTCIPGDVRYRPPLSTPIPTVRGVETAIVVGPDGEEIYTDKYSRVKVQFHWDRDGTNDENSSCWVRVATFWAGKNWGAIHIPRIGQEVIVDFVGGDVDHPLIVGSVYNANTMPPYDLPGNATQSGIKSRSSKGGGSSNFNELRFEDKKGSEQIVVHAEKDLLTEVENDETRTVDHDRTTNIKHDESQTVTNNETIVVDQGNQTITLNQGNQSTTLKMGDQSIKLEMGNQSTTLEMGNQTTKVDLGTIETEAMQSITLKCGPSSIKLDPSGITMQGMQIKITGQIQVQVEGVMIQVSGDALTTVKGAIVMIN